jgi:hypothetical protein
LFTCDWVSSQATKAAASFSGAPAALIDAINGRSFAMSVGFAKLNDAGSSMTGAFATR